MVAAIELEMFVLIAPAVAATFVVAVAVTAAAYVAVVP